MISFLKRLWRDRRGNALVLAGAGLPLLVGSVGLASDTVQWALWKRQLQRAADSAAFAGVYARFQEDSSSEAVDDDLEKNNHLWVPLMSGYPVVTEPTDTNVYTNSVEVGLAVQQRLGFSSMFISAPPVIFVSARAAAIDTGDFCVVALENSNRAGIIVQGSISVNLGCGMISNSPSASDSVAVNGTGHTVTADPVAGVGGVPDINGVSNEQSYHLSQPDPYEGKYSTAVPSGMPCGNMNSHVVSTTGGVTTLSPGCYQGGNAFKFNGGSYNLQPGTYYLNSIDFEVTGGTLTGSGVTIILTGSMPGQVKMNGNGTVQLSAPTSGPYEKMLLIQSANANDMNNSHTFNGTSSSSFDGTIYIPKQQVTFSGSTGAMTKCAMIVARRVEFAGNANIQNNTTGCTAASKVKGKAIRLIA